MPSSDSFFMDISKIIIVHEFVLDHDHRCQYPCGRASFGLVHCTGGSAEYIFNSGAHLTVSEGDTLLLSPAAAYSIVTKRAFLHYTVNFTLNKMSREQYPIEKEYCLLNGTGAEQYARSLAKLTLIWAEKDFGYEMLSMSSLYSLLYSFLRDYRNQESPADFSLRLQPARDYINQSFNRPITLETLAKLCNMSVTNFRREWQKIYRSTPMQYRDEVRLAYAKDLLSTGYYLVSEVAQKCGFDNVGYFIRFFKKHTALSPKEYKKRAL